MYFSSYLGHIPSLTITSFLCNRTPKKILFCFFAFISDFYFLWMPDMKAYNGPFGTGGCTSLCILANAWKAESQLIFVFKIQAAIDFSQTEALHLMKCRDTLRNALQLAAGLWARQIALLFQALSNSQRRPKRLSSCR